MTAMEEEASLNGPYPPEGGLARYPAYFRLILVRIEIAEQARSDAGCQLLPQASARIMSRHLPARYRSSFATCAPVSVLPPPRSGSWGRSGFASLR